MVSRCGEKELQDFRIGFANFYLDFVWGINQFHQRPFHYLGGVTLRIASDPIRILGCALCAGGTFFFYNASFAKIESAILTLASPVITAVGSYLTMGYRLQ